jgi:hypothetical protein
LDNPGSTVVIPFVVPAYLAIPDRGDMKPAMAPMNGECNGQASVLYL